MFIAVILALTHGKVGGFADETSGIKVLAHQQTLPRAIYDSSLALSLRLKNGEPIEADLERLRTDADAFDRALSVMSTNSAVVGPSGKLVTLSALTTPEAKGHIAESVKLWEGYKTNLNRPVLEFSGSPYAQAAATPAQAPDKGETAAAPSSPESVLLSPRGRRLQGAVNALNEYGAKSHTNLAKHSAELQKLIESHSSTQAAVLQGIQVGGMVAALLLLGAIFFYFARNMRKEEAVSIGHARKPRTSCAR